MSYLNKADVIIMNNRSLEKWARVDACLIFFYWFFLFPICGAIESTYSYTIPSLIPGKTQYFSPQWVDTMWSYFFLSIIIISMIHCVGFIRHGLWRVKIINEYGDKRISIIEHNRLTRGER
jgi:hypothetical protein